MQAGPVRLLAGGGAERGLLRARSVMKRAAATAAPTCSRRKPSCAPTRFPKKQALAALKPLLEDRAVLKIAQNMKYDWLVFAQRGIETVGYDDTMLISYVLDAGKGGHGMDDLRQALAQPRHHPFRGRRRLRQEPGHLRPRRHRQGDRIRRRGRRRDAAAVVRAQRPARRRARHHRLRDAGTRHAGRCWRAWSGAAFPSTARCSRACRASSRRSRRGWKTRSRSWPASRSIPARPKQIGDILFGKMSAAAAAPRPRPGNGRPARASWKSSPSKATNCRARFSTGGRCRSCARPTPRRCRTTSTRRRTACTPPTRSPPPRPAGCRRRSRTCRTSRSAPRTAARSARPSSPRPA